MADVADDQHAEPGKIRALALAQRQHVEQALRRVRTAAVAGIDERSPWPGPGGQRRDSAVVGMAHDEAIHAHRLEILHRVERRLALLRRRGVHIETQGIGAQPRGGQLERTARARRGFEEQRAHGSAGQARAQRAASERLGTQGIG